MSGAVRADAEHLDGVRDVGESVSGGDVLSPRFDSGRLQFDGGAAAATHQVMVMMLAATAVDRFPVVADDHIHKAVIAHGLKGPVDRGEANAITALSQYVVDLLRGEEPTGIAEDISDRRALARLSTRWCLRHDRAPG